jgi:hypothetical protein
MPILIDFAEADETTLPISDNIRQILWKKRFEQAAERLLLEKIKDEEDRAKRRESLDVAD